MIGEGAGNVPPPDLVDLGRDESGQSLRLVGDLGFPDGVHRVRVLRDGARRVLLPADHGWDFWYDRAAAAGGGWAMARELVRSAGAAMRRLATRRERAAVLLAALSAAVAWMFVARASAGLTTLEFGDETEKFVAAQMLRHGRTLYGDIYANHGPLAYAIAWAETFLFGAKDFSQARLAVVALAVLALAAIVFRARGSLRLVSLVLFAAPLSALWFVHPLHMLIYHALDGYLITLMLGLLVVPAILGRAVSPWAAMASGAAGMLAFWAAYPAALPAALCLGAGWVAIAGLSGWRAAWRMVMFAVLGGGLASVPIALWLTLHGSWRGYLAYHFYLNQVVYRRMAGLSPLTFLGGLVLDFDPAFRPHAYAVLLGGIGLLGFAGQAVIRRQPSALLAIVPLAGALLLLNFRGSPGFPDAAQMIACLAVFAAGTASLLGHVAARRTAAWLAVCVCVVASAEFVAHTSLMSPDALPRAQAYRGILGPRPQDPLFAEVRRLTPPDGTILAMGFWPAAYIHAGRLPASGQYYYIPVQAEYDRAPVLGAAIDFCGDIARNQPRAILLLRATPGSPDDLLTYKPCFAEILRRDYVERPELGQFQNEPILWELRAPPSAPSG